MKRLALTALFVLATAQADAGGSDRRPLAGQHENFPENITLASGLNVHNVVYRTEPLGGKALLQIRRLDGLSLSSREGGEISTLSEPDFNELISRLLAIIQRDYGGHLDSIQLEPVLVDRLWADSVERLRRSGIADDYKVEPKSDKLLAAMQLSLGEDALVKSICSQVGRIGKRCGRPTVSMNPLALQDDLLRQRWGHVKHQADAGIKKERIWFAIAVEDK